MKARSAARPTSGVSSESLASTRTPAIIFPSVCPEAVKAMSFRYTLRSSRR